MVGWAREAVVEEVRGSRVWLSLESRANRIFWKA